MALINNHLTTLPQEMQDIVFQTLCWRDLARLSQTSKEMHASVSAYVCSQLTQTAQNLPAGPLNLKEILCLDEASEPQPPALSSNEASCSSSCNEPDVHAPLIRAGAIYKRLCAEWMQMGLDLQSLPKGLPLRTADLEQIQQLAKSLL